MESLKMQHGHALVSTLKVEVAVTLIRYDGLEPKLHSSGLKLELEFHSNRLGLDRRWRDSSFLTRKISAKFQRGNPYGGAKYR